VFELVWTWISRLWRRPRRWRRAVDPRDRYGRRHSGQSEATVPISKREGSVHTLDFDDKITSGQNFELRPWNHKYVVPSLNCDLLREYLARSLRVEIGRVNDAADRAFIQRLIDLTRVPDLELPPFPTASLEVDKLLSKPDPPMAQIVRVVEQDPAFVQRVWARAKTAHYSQPPETLRLAIARLGFDELWKVGMSLCLNEGVFRVRGFQDEVEEVRQHGIIAADVVSWVSGHARGPYYMAGLLHDVGKLVVFRMASVRHAKNRPTVETVEQIIKKYHPAVGVIVAEAWQLGEVVKIGAGFHHNPLAARSEQRRTAAMVQVADIAAHAVIPNRGAREHVGRKDLVEKFGAELNVPEALARARGALGRFDANKERGAA